MLAQTSTGSGNFASLYRATNPARREIASADRKAAEAKPPPPAPAPEADPFSDVPECPNCRTVEFMELISFTDRKTGQPR